MWSASSSASHFISELSMPLLFSHTEETLDKLGQCQGVWIVEFLMGALRIENKGFLCVLTHRKAENCQEREHPYSWDRLNTLEKKKDFWKIALS